MCIRDSTKTKKVESRAVYKWIWWFPAKTSGSIFGSSGINKCLPYSQPDSALKGLMAKKEANESKANRQTGKIIKAEASLRREWRRVFGSKFRRNLPKKTKNN